MLTSPSKIKAFLQKLSWRDQDDVCLTALALLDLQVSGTSSSLTSAMKAMDDVGDRGALSCEEASAHELIVQAFATCWSRADAAGLLLELERASQSAGVRSSVDLLREIYSGDSEALARDCPEISDALGWSFSFEEAERYWPARPSPSEGDKVRIAAAKSSDAVSRALAGARQQSDELHVQTLDGSAGQYFLFNDMSLPSRYHDSLRRKELIVASELGGDFGSQAIDAAAQSPTLKLLPDAMAIAARGVRSKRKRDADGETLAEFDEEVERTKRFLSSLMD